MAGYTEVELGHTQADGQSPHPQAVARTIRSFRGPNDWCNDSRFQGPSRNWNGIAGDDFRCRSGTSDDHAPIWLQGSLSLSVPRNSFAARLDHSVAARTLHVLAHGDGPASETALARDVLAVIYIHEPDFLARFKSIAALRRPGCATLSSGARPASHAVYRSPFRRELS